MSSIVYPSLKKKDLYCQAVLNFRGDTFSKYTNCVKLDFILLVVSLPFLSLFWTFSSLMFLFLRCGDQTCTHGQTMKKELGAR